MFLVGSMPIITQDVYLMKVQDADAHRMADHCSIFATKGEIKSVTTAKAMETRYYEGCGIEGPIRCIFLAEFHPVLGPKIACQFPEDYISKEVFDAMNAYIIPKAQIHRCNMTVNACGHKIIGYPVKIENARYERNAYLFNLCFVCDSWSKSVQYEPVVKKLGEHLILMEEQSLYVSKGSARFPTIMAHLLHDLNTYRKATIVEGETVMHFKVLEVHKDPPPVDDYDVPVVLASVGVPQPPRDRPRRETNKEAGASNPPKAEDEEPFYVDFDDDWDLTTRQLLPYLDGYNHISKIAADSNIEKTLVRACIQNLVYYGVVKLIPVLKFSNTYRATPKFSKIISDRSLQKACMTFIMRGCNEEKLTMSDMLKILCAMQQGSPLSAVCERFPCTKNGVFDIRRLVVFAQIHDLIKSVQRYPIYMPHRNPNPRSLRQEPTGIRAMFTGRHSVEEICCRARVTLPTLEEIIEEDPNVSIIWR